MRSIFSFELFHYYYYCPRRAPEDSTEITNPELEGDLKSLFKRHFYGVWRLSVQQKTSFPTRARTRSVLFKVQFQAFKNSARKKS